MNKTQEYLQKLETEMEELVKKLEYANDHNDVQGQIDLAVQIADKFSEWLRTKKIEPGGGLME